MSGYALIVGYWQSALNLFLQGYVAQGIQESATLPILSLQSIHPVPTLHRILIILGCIYLDVSQTPPSKDCHNMTDVWRTSTDLKSVTTFDDGITNFLRCVVFLSTDWARMALDTSKCPSISMFFFLLHWDISSTVLPPSRIRGGPYTYLLPSPVIV